MFRSISSLIIFVLMSMLSVAQTNCEQGNGQLDSEYPKSTTPEQIVQKVVVNESMLEKTRAQYTYRQEVKIQTFFGRSVDGEYRQVSDISYDERGRQVEHVTFAPVSTLSRIAISPEDIEDIRRFSGFILTADALSQYKVDFIGQQRVDELNTYVFEVGPVAIKPNTRYFKGRIWIEQADLQVVKTCGKSFPDVIRTKQSKRGSEENILPTFVTYRQLIAGRYWFPAYSRSDDVLGFAHDRVPIREIVKYTNYQQAGAAQGK